MLQPTSHKAEKCPSFPTPSAYSVFSIGKKAIKKKFLIAMFQKTKTKDKQQFQEE
jgi:hypothetical protein